MRQSVPFKAFPSIEYSYDLIDLYIDASNRMLYAYMLLYCVIIYGMLLLTPFNSFVIWLSLAVLHLIVREYITQKLKIYVDLQDKQKVDTYFKYSIIMSFFAGLLWGYLIWLIFTYVPYEYHYIGIAIALGVAASAIASLSMIFISYLLFLLPMMSLLIASLLFFGEATDAVVALMAFVYIIVIVPIAKSLYLRTKESFLLSATLKESQKELASLNATLEQRVLTKTQALQHNYYHDQTTGLANLKEFQKVIKQGEDNFIILLDIKEFSLTNKQYGKDIADQLLILTAKLLEHHIQEGTKLYRADNDKFIIYKENTNIKSVKAFAEQILSFFEVYPIDIKGIELFCTFRAGITDLSSIDESLIHGEYALMMAKKKGVKYSIYDLNEDELQNEKSTIESLLFTKKLILEERITPFYQAIYDIKNDEIIKYECLVRGIDKNEIIPPYRFLEAADRLGLTTNITRLMIDRCFLYFNNSQHKFSINITGSDLLDSSFLDFLKIKLKHYNIRPENVTFEILENITTHSSSSVVLDSLGKIKKLGCQIAIDDFGVENSNFSRLLEIDLDYIKIDGLFIKNIHKNEKDQKVVNAMVSLAKTLNVKTVAEFVETREVLEVLKECNVDYAQGYLIGKPQKEIQLEFSIHKEPKEVSSKEESLLV